MHVYIHVSRGQRSGFSTKWSFFANFSEKSGLRTHSVAFQPSYGRRTIPNANPLVEPVRPHPTATAPRGCSALGLGQGEPTLFFERAVEHGSEELGIGTGVGWKGQGPVGCPSGNHSAICSARQGIVPGYSFDTCRPHPPSSQTQPGLLLS